MVKTLLQNVKGRPRDELPEIYTKSGVAFVGSTLPSKTRKANKARRNQKNLYIA